MSTTKGSKPSVKALAKQTAKVPKGAGTTGNGAKPGPAVGLKHVARVPKSSGNATQPKGMAMEAHVNPIPKNASGGSMKDVGGWNQRRAGKKK
jgi:hypothetical protein